MIFLEYDEEKKKVRWHIQIFVTNSGRARLFPSCADLGTVLCVVGGGLYNPSQK